VNPAPSAPAIFGAETGIASWYGHPYHGRKAADGEIYDMETLVAAHRTLPFNTWVRVVNLRNNKVVEVRIIDRGPFIDGRIIDLSHAAANAIDLVGPGVGPVRLEVIRAPSSSAFAPPAPAASAPTVPTRAAAQAAAPASGIPASAAPQTYIPAAFAVQIGIFFDRASAERVRAGMAARYGSARIVPREGGHEMWRVLVGSEATEIAATAISERIRQESGERNAFVVRLDSY
jgi:rare lipoprotein A